LQWPSFNGALASIAVTEGVHDADLLKAPEQYYCVCNTLLSLLGSCLSTFATSALLNSGKFDMMHIQNASLAGAVQEVMFLLSITLPCLFTLSAQSMRPCLLHAAVMCSLLQP
jgi:hypothetical protein